MSSYKALFVVVLAAACSQVRIKGNAQRLRPRAGAKDCSISFFFFALFVGFFLAVASTRSAISSSAGDPRSLRPPLSDLPKLQGLSLRASAESTPISRCCVRERVHFCTGWSRTERAEASFCRCFFFEKDGRLKKNASLPPPTNTLRPSPRPASMSPRLSRPRTRRSTPFWRARTARSPSCASEWAEKGRERRLIFFSMVSSSPSRHSPSSSSRLFFLRRLLLLFPALMNLSFQTLQLSTHNRNATIYVPYLNPNWNPVSD